MNYIVSDALIFLRFEEFHVLLGKFNILLPSKL